MGKVSMRNALQFVRIEVRYTFEARTRLPRFHLRSVVEKSWLTSSGKSKFVTTAVDRRLTRMGRTCAAAAAAA